MQKNQVYELCKIICPKHGIDPILMLAICQQEAAKSKNDPNEFLSDVARLEQGFYWKYTEKHPFATTTEVLFATSFGLTQMMGQSLYESGFFQWHFAEKGDGYKQFFLSPTSNIAVVKALDEYCENPQWQIDYSCQWWLRKLKLAKGDVQQGLLYWNGASNKKYPDEVWKKYLELQKEFLA